jgi:hypothetical protein
MIKLPAHYVKAKADGAWHSVQKIPAANMLQWPWPQVAVLLDADARPPLIGCFVR